MFTNPVGIKVRMVAMDTLISTKETCGDCEILQDGDQGTKVAKGEFNIKIMDDNIYVSCESIEFQPIDNGANGFIATYRNSSNSN